MGDSLLYLAFPVNFLIACLWALGIFIIWKKRRTSALVRFLLSPSATILSIVLLCASCIWIGTTGNNELVRSPIFILVLLFVQTVLYLITLRGYRGGNGKVRWRFVLIHLGLLLSLGSGFWGAPDVSEMRVRLSKGETTSQAFHLDGSINSLGYELKLVDFKSGSDGNKVFYEAEISIDSNMSEKISVNKPLEVNFGENIYLVSISDSSSVLEIVKEPWRYFTLSGIIMLIAGALLLFVRGPRTR